jgi:hypothetical protein
VGTTFVYRGYELPDNSIIRLNLNSKKFASYTFSQYHYHINVNFALTLICKTLIEIAFIIFTRPYYSWTNLLRMNLKNPLTTSLCPASNKLNNLLIWLKAYALGSFVRKNKTKGGLMSFKNILSIPSPNTLETKSTQTHHASEPPLLCTNPFNISSQPSSSLPSMTKRKLKKSSPTKPTLKSSKQNLNSKKSSPFFKNNHNWVFSNKLLFILLNKMSNQTQWSIR